MKRKAVSCLLVLAAIMTMTPTIPTMAAENPDNTTQSTQTTTEAGTQNSVVKYDQASAFTVTIPKSIALSSSKSAEYTVRVQGDVIGNEIITVTPDTSVILSDSNGKDSVTGDISQEKTEFSSTEVNARSGGGTATGSILANNLTSGDWSGNFEFVIGTNQIGNGTAITSENLATYGIKTTGDVVIPEYVTDDDNTRHAVTSISDYAFRDCNEMTSVAIADSVTEIGTGAFVNCSKLSRAAVPNSVKSIGNSAFDGCIKLSSISYNGNEYDLSNIEPAFVENGVSVGSHVFEHSYSEPVYTWSENNSTCTATKTCSECHDIITETADVSTKTTDATCTDEGLNTYTATFKNSDFVTQTKDIQDIPVLEKLTGSVVLSATKGTISYPTAGSFTVTSNKSNGTLSVKSSNPNTATATLRGNTVTVTPGTVPGAAIITVTSAATTSYKAASATYNVTVNHGTLPITAKAYSGTYDGNAHSASVTSSVSGVTFKYGTAKGTYNLTSMPTYTNAGTYVVYYQATKAGYTTSEGSVKTVIQKKATTTSLRSADGILYVTTTGNGTITAQSSDSNIIESVTVNDKTITCMPKKYGNAGTATITVTVGETTNYKASSDTYNVTVSSRLIADSSLSFWHPDNKFEFGYLNGSGQYVVDGGSMWHCVSLIPITTSGYYYIVGRTGGAPRSCLYNDASRNSLYQSFESSDGYYTYIPAGKYLGSLLFRDEGFNALDLRFVTFSK